jgi:hypothetical protein
MNTFLDRGAMQAPWWRHGRRAVRAAGGWPGLAAALLAAVLLAAFVQVVNAGVRDSESRHRVVAAHADALWRCNGFRAVSQRATCRTELGAVASAP